MKKILIILFLFASLLASAEPLSVKDVKKDYSYLWTVLMQVDTQVWYIATAANGGSDTGGDGSITEPWLTLKHACDTITGAAFVGDTISIGAGTFDETAQVVWDEEVSLIGVIASPLTTTITSSSALSPIILGSSATEGTAGNQSISYIAFDGNLTAVKLVYIIGRSNVSVHHCTFLDALESGISFQGRTTAGNGPPTTYSIGNSFHDNTLTNCAIFSSGWGRGELHISGQQTMTVLDNNFDQTDRAAGSNGYCMKFDKEGYNKDVLVDGNTFLRAYEGEAYNINCEFWNSQGGIEVSNNTFWNACLDIAGNPVGSEKGSYAYSFYVHNNNFRTTATNNNEINGVIIEGNASDVIVTQNYFEGLTSCLSMTLRQPTLAMNNIRIHHNVFNNYGWYNVDYGAAINCGTDQADAIFSNIYILNNTFYDDGVGFDPRHIVWILTHDGTFTNWVLKNNILLNTKVAFFQTQLQTGGSGTFNSLTLSNNIAYGNANSNNPSFDAGLTPITLVNTGQITSDPLFRSTTDFHLQAGSPAIDAGLDVSATTGGLDFHGASRYGATYDIGAFEWGAGRLLKIGTVLPTIDYKVVLIDH